MKSALHAEWTKLHTAPGTGWVLLVAVSATVGLSWLASAAVGFQGGGLQDPVKISLIGVQAGQAIFALFGVLIITGEYSSGMIRSTLSAMPRRWTMLAAKAAMLTGLALPAGVLAVLGSIVVGRFILPGNGFTTSLGFPPLSLADPPTMRAAAGSVIYLALIALLGLGIATLVRDSAVAVGAVLGLLYLLPILTQVVGDPEWKRLLQQIAPTTAGLAIQSTVDLESLAISPWLGLGVLAAWAAGAMLAAAAVLQLRDA